jgi:hypothetical protein
MRRNLTTVYRRVTPADRDAGLAWYPHARDIVRSFATAYGIHDATVACVIAALSPQCEWSRNIVVAEDLLAGRGPSIGGPLLANITKAQRIINDRAIDTVAYFKAGPKVFHFARNLMGDASAITVDTHAAQCAIADPAQAIGLTWPHYDRIATAFRDVANRQELAPCDLQAVLWVTWKRLYPRSVKAAIAHRRTVTHYSRRS